MNSVTQQITRYGLRALRGLCLGAVVLAPLVVSNGTMAQEEGTNPFIGTLSKDQTLYYDLIEHLSSLQEQVVEVNRRVLETQAMTRQAAQEIEDVRTAQLSAGNVGGAGSELLSNLEAMESEEEQASALVRALTQAEFIMCANGQALFRDLDGAHYLVSLTDADSNEKYRTFGGCD